MVIDYNFVYRILPITIEIPSIECVYLFQVPDVKSLIGKASEVAESYRNTDSTGPPSDNNNNPNSDDQNSNSKKS